MATLYPAQAIGVDHKLGLIKEGMIANLAIFDSDFNVSNTIVNGEMTFGSKKNQYSAKGATRTTRRKGGQALARFYKACRTSEESQRRTFEVCAEVLKNIERIGTVESLHNASASCDVCPKSVSS